MSKEVTLRQCAYCEKEFNNQDVFCHLEYNVCVRCKVGHINHKKKEAGDKTEFVLIEKPRDQRLGQAIIMGLNNGGLMVDPHEDGIDYINHSDTQDIQEKINALNK